MHLSEFVFGEAFFKLLRPNTVIIIYYFEQ